MMSAPGPSPMLRCQADKSLLDSDGLVNPWYFGFISRDEEVELLHNAQPGLHAPLPPSNAALTRAPLAGEFVVRVSDTKPRCFVASYVRTRGEDARRCLIYRVGQVRIAGCVPTCTHSLSARLLQTFALKEAPPAEAPRYGSLLDFVEAYTAILRRPPVRSCVPMCGVCAAHVCIACLVSSWLPHTDPLPSP